MQNGLLPLSHEKPAPYAYFVLAVLVAANLLNYADRFIVSAVLPLIEKDWGISTQVQGYLSSAFTVGFMVSAPFVGALADRRRRTIIVAVCVLVWSVATIGAGLAPNIGWMLAFRVVIGLGEAGLLVVGPTLVADSFPRSARARALSIFYLGTPLGGALGYAFGGYLGEHFTWRVPLIWAGAIGILPTLLLLVMREPARGAFDAADSHLAAHGPRKAGSLRDYLALTRNRSFLLVILCLTAAAAAGTPLMHFLPKYMTQVRGVPLKEASLQVGLVAAFSGTFGSIAFGWAADRLCRRTRKAHFLLAAGAYLLAYPCMLVGLYAPHPAIYLAGLAVGVFMFFGALTTLNTVVANVTRPEIRAMSYSALIFCMHCFGDTFSPPFFGHVIDVAGPHRGFFLMTLPFAVSAVACLLGLRWIETDLRRATGEDSANTNRMEPPRDADTRR